MSLIKGIHHITAISSDARKTIQFYTQVLGLRMVKKTVNFDSPETYHLYFGNEAGEPGTALTFFPFENAGTGRRGPGQVTKISFAIPEKSIGFWMERFLKYNVKHEFGVNHWGKPSIKFYDFDDLALELVQTQEHGTLKPWSGGEVSQDYAIRGFYSAELSVENLEKTEEVLKVFGYEKLEETEFAHRYVCKEAPYAKYLELVHMKGWPKGIVSAGTVHHIAFAVENRETERKVREQILGLGLEPTEQIDRNYFYSVYFREPSSVLFEIATNDPGFTVDESLETLGTQLKLPAQYEGHRAYIEAILPDLEDSSEESGEEEFKYLFRKGTRPETFVLLHGTGADERDLIPLAKEINPHFNILSLRGNVVQQGQNRFFVRNSDGTFDEENIHQEVEKFDNFIEKITKKYHLKLESLIFLGFSNGANFAISYFFDFPQKIKTGLFLHPMVPFEPKNEIDLTSAKAFITYGEKDEFSTEEQMQNLKEIFGKTKLDFEFYKHSANHVITDEEVEKIREFLAKHL